MNKYHFHRYITSNIFINNAILCSIAIPIIYTILRLEEHLSFQLMSLDLLVLLYLYYRFLYVIAILAVFCHLIFYMIEKFFLKKLINTNIKYSVKQQRIFFLSAIFVCLIISTCVIFLLEPQLLNDLKNLD